MSKPEKLPNPTKWAVRHQPPSGQPVDVSVERPFLLAGSAPCCDLQLGRSAPWIAYFFSLGREGVEVWPLDKQAQALWGCVVPAVPLPCCGSTITFSRMLGKLGNDLATREPKESRPPEVWPIIKIDTPEASARVLLNQPVTTLGSELPSLVRVPNSPLAPCQVVFMWSDPELTVIYIPRAGSTSGVQQLVMRVGEELKNKNLRIAFQAIKEATAVERLPNDAGIVSGLDYEQVFRKHAEKLRDTFSCRQSLRDRRRRLWICAFSAIFSVIAVVLTYLLLSKVVPFM